MKQTGYIFDGNHFVTDFVNTRKNIKGVRTELLHNWYDLLQWLEQAGKRRFVTGQLDADHALKREEIFERILSFRNRLEQAVIDIIRDKEVPDSFIAYINKELTRYRGYYQLDKQGSAASAVRYYDISQLPALFLEEAALFFMSFKPDNLKKCENTVCILYFYDTSRNQQRRWCSMERCGNRVKVNQHYHRKKQEKSSL
ncbi:CGNR zinc finger domain-containing protein [Paenibacillus sp. SI8]|uniref:CGNR zinc finger domain-containing protein n=1 Tax=unclassified Paenibacillus TaxID=185978 RepID=UPI0034656BE4